MDIHNPVYNSVIIYIVLISSLLILKPESIYDKNTGKFKPFGFGEGKVIISFPTVVISSGVLLYTLFLCLDVVCKKFK